MFTDPHQQASYQYQPYHTLLPYNYPYNTPIYEARPPRESAAVYAEKDRDRKRPSHIFPHKQSQQSYSKEAEQPSDSRYFEVETRFVPVQIVDADKLRRDREEKDRARRTMEERRRADWREDSIPSRGAWENTDYSTKVAYRHSTGHHGDKHIYDHKRTTRVYHTNPTDHTTHSGAGRYLWKTEEHVKEYEVYQSKQSPKEVRQQSSRATRYEPREYRRGRGHHHRARD